MTWKHIIFLHQQKDRRQLRRPIVDGGSQLKRHVRYICFKEACTTVNQKQSCTNGPARRIDCVILHL